MNDQNAPYTAVQIANEFIARGISDDIQDMTNMKIQKLVYFAQGYYLACYDMPLIQEHFIVGKHGPLIRQLYEEIKRIKIANNEGTKQSFREILIDENGSISGISQKDAFASPTRKESVKDAYASTSQGGLQDAFASPTRKESVNDFIVREILDIIWEDCKNLSSRSCSRISNKYNSPWAIAKCLKGIGARIENEEIRKQFSYFGEIGKARLKADLK